jgi:hypothetical protein
MTSPTPSARCSSNILATFAEVDLLRLRTREGMAVARAKGKLSGKQPKLTARQQSELTRMYTVGDSTIADFMEVFSVGRAAVYCCDSIAFPGTGKASDKPSDNVRRQPRTQCVAPRHRYPPGLR